MTKYQSSNDFAAFQYRNTITINGRQKCFNRFDAFNNKNVQLLSRNYSRCGDESSFVCFQNRTRLFT